MFIRKPRNASVELGGTARLDVRVDGNPAPAISWAKNGVELAVDSGRCSVEAGKDGRYCLVISDCDGSDSTEFGCTAVNELGRVTCSCRLDVLRTTSE